MNNSKKRQGVISSGRLRRTVVFSTTALLLLLASPACRRSRPTQNAASDHHGNTPLQAAQTESAKDSSHEPREPHRPEPAEIRTSPRDGGFVRDLERPLSVLFPRPPDPEDFSFTLKPDPGDWAVIWDPALDRVELKPGKPFTKGTRYEWKIRWENERRIVRFTASGPSSLHLIDAAEQQGILDADTAWTYRLQRLHEPEKLPPSFQSAAPIRCGTSVWKRFKRERARLKPETLEALRPYLVRPTHPDSFYRKNAARAATSGSPTAPGSSSPSGYLYAQEAPPDPDEEEIKRPENMFSHIDWRDKIRVWYAKGGRAKAQRAVHYLETRRMYDRYKDIMGTVPLSDEGACSPCGSIKNAARRRDCRRDTCGGDGKIDIYLVPPTEPGMYDAKTRESDHGWCREVDDGDTAAAFLLINRELEESPKNYFASALAHELFHAFQDAWDAWEDEWWVEGTAVWAEDFIGPEWNTEQDYLEDAFDPKAFLLKTLTSDEDDHPYGIYLFPFHVSREYNPEKIGFIWQDCGLDDIDALSAVTLEVGDFQKFFKEFTLRTTDMGKHRKYFPDSGGALSLRPHHKEQKEEITPEIKPILPVDVELPPLGARYLDFRNLCDPEATPHIRFDLEEFASDSGISVQAIIDPEGRAEDQDWSDLSEKVFCINHEDEAFDSIYVVVTSHHEETPFTGRLHIEMNAVECDECYAYVTRTYDSEYRGRDSETQDHRTATIYMGFGPAVISGMASMSMDRRMNLFPLKTLQVAAGSARYRHRSGKRTEERSGKIMKAPLPNLPPVPVGGQTIPPIFLILYTEAKTGEVSYAMLPDPDVFIVWNDGRRETYGIRGVSQEEVPIEGMFGSIPSDGKVTASDGETWFEGGGEHEYTNRGANSYEHVKEKYSWRIVRRKSERKPGKKPPGDQ